MTTVQAVVEAITPWLSSAEGVTISGGEPFDQRDALRALLLELRGIADVDILVYSGYSRERLDPTLQTLGDLIDALITDPYDARYGQTLELRGSDNQRLHLLTPRGKSRFERFQHSARAEMALDIMFDENGLAWISGIPRQQDMERLKELLALEGHRIVTSQALGSQEGPR